MSKEVLKVELPKIDDSQLPEIISGKIEEIKRVDKFIKKAKEQAEKAKDSANETSIISAGLGHKKKAIESLQETASNLAEAQTASVEAQTALFEYQKKLTEITKYLFILGCYNLAANRTVVRKLKSSMENASQEELDDLAKQEIISVIKQLKAQEDIMIKQSELSKHVKQHDEQLLKQQEKEELLEKQIETKEEKDEQQDVEIIAQAKKDSEHDRLIAEQAKKDIEHDRLLAEHSKLEAEHERIIAEHEAKDKELEENTSRLQQEITLLKNRVEEKYIELENKYNDINSEKASKAIALIPIAISIIALTVACVQFFV